MQLLPNGKQSFFTPSGQPLANGKVYFYQPGTSTPATTYQDASGNTANPDPVVLDGNGQAVIYGIGSYRQVVQDANGVTVWDQTTTAPDAGFIDLGNTTNGKGADLVANATKKVASVAALRALRVPQGTDSQTVLVDGLDTPIIWSATSTATDDGLTVFIPNSLTSGQAGRWLRGFTGPVNVKWFGAKGDGVTDDTAAFNSAIATGRKVFVPYTAAGYVVNNIAVVGGMVVEGEKPGVTGGPALIVTQNNAGAFHHSSSSAIFHVDIRNFVIRAKDTSISGARGYLQDDKSVYTAYCRFENIETDQTLFRSYDGFFIFTTWNNCRDGYVGNPTTMGHGFIECTPATWGQGNQCNLNTVMNTQVFNSSAGSSIQSAVHIGWGAQWTFENCDFEALGTSAVYTQGIYNLKFVDTWFERITSSSCLSLNASGDNSMGTRTALFDNCQFNLANTTTQVVYLGSASYAAFRNCGFAQGPSGIKLSNYGQTVTIVENPMVFSGSLDLSGHNTVIYSSGHTLRNGAADDSSGAADQLNGMQRATKGFTSAYNLQVGTTFVDVASYNLSGGLAFINGYNNSGGATGTWLVSFRNGGTPVVVSSSDGTGLSPSFQVGTNNNLQMKTTSGSLSVSVAMLV